MKKVLIFTYYWPPAGGVSVQRFLKFTKFLPEFGWQPIIVTVANGSYPYTDESLLQQVDKSVKVYRTKTFEPFEFYNLLRGKKGKALPVVSVGAAKNKSFFQRFSEYIRANFFVPDARVGWVKYAIKQAEEILKTEKIDAIVTTGPPHSTHLIGLDLKQRFTVKWIADFRDPWTGIFYNDILPRTEATRKKDSELETRVLNTADHVTVISPGMKKEFESRAKNIEVVFNGYDEEEFATETKTTNNAFTIRYVGNLMASQNAALLWQTINTLSKEHKLRIELVGRVDEEVKRSIAEAGIASLVSYRDFVDHHTAIGLMKTADLLLFAIPDVKGNELILTGKLFEYLASKTEMISFGPVQGNAADILKQTGRKAMIDFKDGAEIQKQLNDALRYFAENKGGYKYSTTAHEVFSRRNQTKELAALLA
ncbi:MAG: glycosyltransferase [Chitinophagales bacterium]